MSAALEWVLKNNSATLSTTSAGSAGESTAVLRLTEAWERLWLQTERERNLLAEEISDLNHLKEGIEAESKVLEGIHELLDEEDTRACKETKQYNSEIALRREERKLRLQKEESILSDLKERESKTRHVARCLLFRDERETTRESDAKVRMQAQANRRETLQVPLDMAASEVEQELEARTARETARLESQKKEVCVLNYDRDEDNNGRSACEEVESDMRSHLEDVNPQVETERGAWHCDKEALDEDTSARTSSAAVSAEGNPRSPCENADESANRGEEDVIRNFVDADYDSDHSDDVDDDDYTETSGWQDEDARVPNSLAPNRDASFEVEVWQRRAALEHIIANHVEELEVENSRVAAQHVISSEEDTALTEEVASLEATENQLRRLEQGREDEDELVDDERQLWQEKKEALRQPIVEVTSELTDALAIAEERASNSTARQEKIAISRNEMQAEDQKSPMRQACFQRLLQQTRDRAIIVRKQLKQQRAESVRYWHSRSTAHEEREEEEAEHRGVLEPALNNFSSVLDRNKKNINIWSRALAADDTDGSAARSECDDRFQQSNDPWLEYAKDKTVVVPECGFQDTDLHDREFVALATELNRLLEKAFEDVCAAFDIEEEQRTLEIPHVSSQSPSGGSLRVLHSKVSVSKQNETSLHKEGVSARELELSLIRQDKEKRKEKEATVDEQIAEGHQVHQNFDFTADTFDKACQFSQQAHLKATRSHASWLEQLADIPEYEPDRWNKSTVQNASTEASALQQNAENQQQHLTQQQDVITRQVQMLPGLVETSKESLNATVASIEQINPNTEYEDDEDDEDDEDEWQYDRNEELENISRACKQDISRGNALLPTSKDLLPLLNAANVAMQMLCEETTLRCTSLHWCLDQATDMEKDRLEIESMLEDEISETQELLSGYDEALNDRRDGWFRSLKDARTAFPDLENRLEKNEPKVRMVADAWNATSVEEYMNEAQSIQRDASRHDNLLGEMRQAKKQANALPRVITELTELLDDTLSELEEGFELTTSRAGENWLRSKKEKLARFRTQIEYERQRAQKLRSSSVKCADGLTGIQAKIERLGRSASLQLSELKNTYDRCKELQQQRWAEEERRSEEERRQRRAAERREEERRVQAERRAEEERRQRRAEERREEKRRNLGNWLQRKMQRQRDLTA